MQIVSGVLASFHVKCTFNRPRGSAFSAIKSEVPTAATVVTVEDPEGASKEHVKCSLGVLFNKFTVLLRREIKPD